MRFYCLASRRGDSTRPPYFVLIFISLPGLKAGRFNQTTDANEASAAALSAVCAGKKFWKVSVLVHFLCDLYVMSHECTH
jgi:hypothetical protein